MKDRFVAYVIWFRQISSEFGRNHSSLTAGGLSFFVALALAPTAVALGSLAGLLLNPTQVGNTLSNIANDTPAAADHAESTVNVLVSLAENASAGAFTLTSIISILLAVYASSKVVFGLRQAMDTVFHVEVARFGLMDRLVSAVVTFIGLLLTVSVVVVLAVLPRFLDWLRVDSLSSSTVNVVLGWCVFTVLTYCSVRAIFYHVPASKQRVPWKSWGVAISTVWIVAVTGGVGLYAKYSSSFGAAVLLFGTAVVILLWMYFGFLGLLWGATVEANRQEQEGTVKQENEQG